MLIHGNDFFRLASKEKHDVKITACGDVIEPARAVSVELDHGSLSIRVSEEHSEELVHVLRLHQAEWVHTICLLASTTIIIRRCLPICPHGIGSLFQQEISFSLSKSKYPLAWQLKAHLHVFVLKNQCLSSSVYHHIFRAMHEFPI